MLSQKNCEQIYLITSLVFIHQRMFYNKVTKTHRAVKSTEKNTKLLSERIIFTKETDQG